jgi:hypothetical protein
MKIEIYGFIYLFCAYLVSGIGKSVKTCVALVDDKEYYVNLSSFI